MKTIKIKPNKCIEDNFLFWEDCETVVKAFLNAGYIISLTQAKEIWSKYSDDYEAGWLVMPEDRSKIVACLREYFDEEEM